MVIRNIDIELDFLNIIKAPIQNYSFKHHNYMNNK